MGNLVDFLDAKHEGPCLCGSATSREVHTTRLSEDGNPRIVQRIRCTSDRCPAGNPHWKRIWCTDLTDKPRNSTP
jgi:hypothetical protein